LRFCADAFNGRPLSIRESSKTNQRNSFVCTEAGADPEILAAGVGESGSGATGSPGSPEANDF